MAFAILWVENEHILLVLTLRSLHILRQFKDVRMNQKQMKKTHIDFPVIVTIFEQRNCVLLKSYCLWRRNGATCSCMMTRLAIHLLFTIESRDEDDTSVCLVWSPHSTLRQSHAVIDALFIDL